MYLVLSSCLRCCHPSLPPARLPFPRAPNLQPGWGGSPFKAGIFGGETLDGPGVVAISKLPTKQELMQRLAVALNSVPTKLGRSINLVPTKVGRAVKLAFAPEGEDGEEASAEEAAPEAAAE